VDAIVVEELRKRYGKVQALDGVTFSVQEGEVFGLLGPNGAGKTTTVKVLATLTKPDSGRAEVVFHDAVEEPDAVRRTIGYVPQSSGVDRDATGRENLMLQGRVQGMSGRKLRERVDELLELVGIAEASDRVVRGYSGGMKRRLDVALGLVHRPRVVFLDEPTTGLAPEARAAMGGELGPPAEPAASLQNDRPPPRRAGHHQAAREVPLAGDGCRAAGAEGRREGVRPQGLRRNGRPSSGARRCRRQCVLQPGSQPHDGGGLCPGNQTPRGG